MLAGGLPSGFLLSAWEIKTQGMGTITPGIIGGILFLGIISTAIAMFLWNYAFARTSSRGRIIDFLRTACRRQFIGMDVF